MAPPRRRTPSAQNASAATAAAATFSDDNNHYAMIPPRRRAASSPITSAAAAAADAAPTFSTVATRAKTSGVKQNRQNRPAPANKACAPVSGGGGGGGGGGRVRLATLCLSPPRLKASRQRQPHQLQPHQLQRTNYSSSGRMAKHWNAACRCTPTSAMVYITRKNADVITV